MKNVLLLLLRIKKLYLWKTIFNYYIYIYIYIYYNLFKHINFGGLHNIENSFATTGHGLLLKIEQTWEAHLRLFAISTNL